MQKQTNYIKSPVALLVTKVNQMELIEETSLGVA